MMNYIAKKRSYSRKIIWILVCITVLTGMWSLYALRKADQQYGRVLHELSKSPTLVKEVTIGGSRLGVPTFSLFSGHGIWSLTSKAHPFRVSSAPDLIPVTVPHADESKPMSIAAKIDKPLRDLVASARSDGISFMISSAHRSKDDQKELYDAYMISKGRDYTISHVALPGTSEHQTGLAIDFSTESSACRKDSNACELNSAGISWLANNAHTFGFIQRYPMGKQSITGIANEEWHYRYVGVALAKALHNSDLTLDEFVQQTAPGYAN